MVGAPRPWQFALCPSRPWVAAVSTAPSAILDPFLASMGRTDPTEKSVFLLAITAEGPPPPIPWPPPRPREETRPTGHLRQRGPGQVGAVFGRPLALTSSGRQLGHPCRGALLLMAAASLLVPSSLPSSPGSRAGVTFYFRTSLPWEGPSSVALTVERLSWPCHPGPQGSSPAAWPHPMFWTPCCQGSLGSGPALPTGSACTDPADHLHVQSVVRPVRVAASVPRPVPTPPPSCSSRSTV